MYTAKSFCDKIFSYVKRFNRCFVSDDERGAGKERMNRKPENQKENRSHHDYIQFEDFLSFLDLTKKIGKDFDVMIEAKAKDEALFRLIRQIKYKTTYFVQGTTIFLNLSK